MALNPTPFDSDAADGTTHHIIRMKPDGSGKQELVNAHWGINPRFADGVEYRFVRSEGKAFPSRRCLVPVSDFRMTVGSRTYRVTRDDGNHFYLAGVWEPAMAGWPLAFRVITVAANPDVERYQDRHGAMIERRRVMDWLAVKMPEHELLVTPPAHVFFVEELGAKSTGRKPAQNRLAL